MKKILKCLFNKLNLIKKNKINVLKKFFKYKNFFFEKLNKNIFIFIVVIIFIFYVSDIFKVEASQTQNNFSRIEFSNPPQTGIDIYYTKEEEIIIPDYVIEMIEKYPETYELIKYFQEFYNEKDYYNLPINIEIDLTTDDVPLFIQWDKRWAFRKYGKDTVMATSACAPTCLAMVVTYFTKDSSINPKAVADYSFDNKFYIEKVGTTWNFINEASKYYGLESETVDLNEVKIKTALDDGKIIIACMGQGHFTTGGHFIILKGYDKDGNFLVNDPNSITKSNKSWSSKIILSEIKKGWAITKK